VKVPLETAKTMTGASKDQRAATESGGVEPIVACGGRNGNDPKGQVNFKRANCLRTVSDVVA